MSASIMTERRGETNVSLYNYLYSNNKAWAYLNDPQFTCTNYYGNLLTQLIALISKEDNISIISINFNSYQR